MSHQESHEYSWRETDRQLSIDRFGRFIKDLPFLDLTLMEQAGSADTIKTATEITIGKIASGDSIAVTEDYLEEFEQAQQAGARFERINARSGQNSRHGIFFGNFMSDAVKVPMAVKVFDENQGGLQAATDEVIKTQRIIDYGVSTFRPIAVGEYGGSAYSAWKLKPGATSFESIDWSKYAENPHGNPGMSAMLQKSAVAIAGIHNNGWLHGDLHPRNIAMDAIGRVFPIDWETAHLEDLDKNIDPSVRYERARQDVATLMTACFHDREHDFNPGLGIFNNLSPEEGAEGFNRAFFNTYLDTRVKLAGKDTVRTEDLHQLRLEVTELPHMLVY